MAFDTYSALNISDFISRTKFDGFSRLNRIAVRINPPAALTRGFKADSFTYYAEAVTIPSYDLLLNTINLNGPAVAYPTRSDYNQATVTFLVDDQMSQRKFFDAWVNYINPKERGFDLRYRDDYIGKVTMYQITEDGRSISYGIELLEAYPFQVGSIRGNWSEQEVSRLDASFSYRYWRNLKSSETENNKIIDELLGVTVTGTRKEETLLGVTVTGTRSDADTLVGVTVTGQKRSTEVLESVVVTGRRKPSITTPKPNGRPKVQPKRPAKFTGGGGGFAGGGASGGF
jgi:hypothetical protein